MSLLRRIQQQNGDEDDDAPTLDSSPVLQLSSAWSVWPELKKIPALKTLAENVKLSAEPLYAPKTWAVLGSNGVIYANPLHLASADEWKFVLAHLLIHLGLRHQADADETRQAVYEVTANTLVLQLGIGTPPEGFLLPSDIVDADAEVVYDHWKQFGLVPPPGWTSAAGAKETDILPLPVGATAPPVDGWGMMLTRGLLENIGSKGNLVPWATVGTSKARQALQWCVDHFPLLSSLAAHFKIIEDRDTIQAFQIGVAAVIAERMEILFNPDIDLTPAEMRFIMCHELMHVGLLHHVRREGRDAFIWNVACDFVINAWLIDMGVGEMPPRGGLYNPKFVGMSSNEIYDKLIADPNYARRLVTFRGLGVGDILPPGSGGNPVLINGQKAEDLADMLLKQGIKAHMEGPGGLLPAGLLEMVTPTHVPPPQWKMSLTRWFDAHFEPMSPVRSYARQSRRQQATPDIPRPRHAIPQLPDGSSIFGVLLDTSGSMDNDLLSKCLGAIVSLSEKHNIKQVRLVFCDATPYDEGFVPVTRLSEPMHIKGRGGTRLQPGIKLLEEAKDFPKDAPILVITDCGCDVLTIQRDHAFLIPEGRNLPFKPVGPVFTLK
ncbi:MAG: peptidase [Chloroflexota bacterium]